MEEKQLLELLVKQVGQINSRLDNVDSKLDSMDSRLDTLEKDMKEVKGDIKTLKGQNETIAIQVNQNNQILKKDNVKDWLELGSEVMTNLEKKK
ncbi:tetrahydromethanopterin S-methyltransferase subunit G [Halonatronum saccharophilum]|uniref:tetrahydromethanopterin S-methyltransferase subunit G n=1 Tax=Halonatronum saccharophilum TaxID=150060 RepID=UPI0004B16A6F|nr:tetrahydromethanopterin S-methyltransferase subunit G [Halonatronum saccharophilum]